MVGLDNKTFLKRIANAIAHGNYVDLLKINEIEERWKVNGEDKSLDLSGDCNFNLAHLCSVKNISKYDDNTSGILREMNKQAPMVKVSPLQFYMSILEGSSANDLEVLKIRCGESVVELSFGDIDEILLFKA